MVRPVVIILPSVDVTITMRKHVVEIRTVIRREKTGEVRKIMPEKGLERGIVERGHHFGIHGFVVRPADHGGPGVLGTGIEL